MKPGLGRRRRRVSSDRRSSHRFLGRALRGVERCEPRWMLATDVHVFEGASGTGTLDPEFIANGGVLDFTATDVGGDTLSSGAMASIAANVNILVEATQTVDFYLGGTPLSLATGNGNTVTFSTNTAGGGDITFLNANDTLTTAGGDIIFSAGDFLTVANLNSGGGSIQLTTGVAGGFSEIATTPGLASGGGDITLHADNATITTPVNAGSGIVTIAPVTPADTISLGGADAASTLGIDDTELGQITASVVRIGGNLQTGAIRVEGTITAHAGYNTLDLIATGTGGAIAENGGSIAVANLALQAKAGIGDAGAINLVDPINAAFNNTTTGGVALQGTSALTVAAVDGVNTSVNNASAGVVTLSADGPLTFAVDTSSSGTLTATTSEVGVVPEEDIIVDPGVTVRSNTANVLFSSADNLLLSAGSTVTAPLGTVTLNLAVDDSDDDAVAMIAGAVSTSGAVPTLSGGPTFGPTSMLIDYTSGAALPQGLAISAGIAGTPLTITDGGGAARHTYDITDASITRDGAAPITYNGSNTNIGSVTVTGSDATGSDGDVFTITPSANVTFTVHGGLPAPPTTPGDTLNLKSFIGATLSETPSATGFSGNWAVTGDQPISFDGIETVDVPANLSVTNTDGKTAAVPGTSDTYTIVVTNAGPSNVTGASVTDTFPTIFTGATYTATATGGATGFTASGSGNISDTVNLPVGGTITYVVTGTISASATGSLSTTATVTAPVGVTNTNAANGTATDSDTLTAQADLSITNTDGKTTAVAGTSDTYTIVVTNAGPSGVTGASVTDAFPAILTGATFTATATGGATGFTAGGSGSISDTVNVPVGSTITYVVTGTISASATGTLSNTSTVTLPAGVTDTNAANGSATDSDTLTAQADLSITNTDGKTTGVARTSDTYTIVVTNAGPSGVTGASVTDAFPAILTGATFTATATGGATGFTASGSGSISDTVNLPVGGTITYVVTGTVSASATGTLSNMATVTAPAGVSDTNTANNSATDSDTLTVQADLSITKTDGKTTVVAGTSDTYTIVVTNAGPSGVTGASVTDTLPASFTGATFTATATGVATGFTASGSGNFSDTVNLPVGSTITYTVTGTVSASATGSLSNTSTVTAPAGVTDTNTANNSATDSDTITPPPLTGFGYLAGVPGDGTAQTLVQNLYRELLGRNADSSGQAYFVTMDSEAGHQAVIEALLNSTEYKTHYVTTVYETFLGRAPDPGGVQFWTDLLGKPGTPGGHNGSADEKFVLAAIVGSDELFLDAGKTAQGWVNALYHDLLGRSPEASGLAFWTSLAQGPSANDRDGLVRAFLSSPEAEYLLLDSFYPAPGGTAGHLLPAPGTPVSPGSNDLAILTGDGWENLYPEGPSGSSPQANDVFFADLALGASWDDIQFALLTTGQYYTNANRPLTL